MNIDRAQFQNILQAAYTRFEPGHRTDGTLTPSDAELVVAIAQHAVAADRVEDPDEQALFDQLAAHVYAAAKLATTPPTLAPLDDEEQRIEQLRTHAAQLQGKGAGALAYALAYILTIADLELNPDEMDTVEILREGLGLDQGAADDLVATVSELITPPE